MSPGNRSYDAIGLMKQISEQTAAAYANAEEILGNETPKALPKDASGNDKDCDQENNDLPKQPGKHSQSASGALVRLDFPNTCADIFPSPLSSIHASFPYFPCNIVGSFMLHDTNLLARVRHYFLN